MISLLLAATFLVTAIILFIITICRLWFYHHHVWVFDRRELNPTTWGTDIYKCEKCQEEWHVEVSPPWTNNRRNI